MKVRILESARRDLRAGYDFYERQETGIGDYFLNSLFADIDSLALYGGLQALAGACIARIEKRLHRRSSMVAWVNQLSASYSIHFVAQIRVAANYGRTNAVTVASLMQQAGV